MRISSFVCAFSHRPAIGPTNPHSFFSQDRQFDRQIRQGALLVLELAFEGFVDFAADVTLRASRLGAEALQGALLDLLPDAGQIAGEETFTPEEFAHGFAAVLRFQINLELFLGAQMASFLFGALVWCFRWIATAHVFPF